MTSRAERLADARTFAGFRYAAFARSTGTLVVVVNGAEAGVDTADGEQPWSTICDDHGGICSHGTLALARGWAPHPNEWCPYCQGDRP